MFIDSWKRAICRKSGGRLSKVLRILGVCLAYRFMKHYFVLAQGEYIPFVQVQGVCSFVEIMTFLKTVVIAVRPVVP